MPPNFVFCTGFENGATNADQVSGSIDVVNTDSRTGSYSCRARTGGSGTSEATWTLPPAAEYWMGIGFKNQNASQGAVGYRLSDNTTMTVGVSDGKTAIFRNGALIEKSNAPLPSNQWVHYAIYLRVGEADGRFRVHQDGVLVIDYTGDTQPGAGTTITGVYQKTGGGTTYTFVDDIAVSSTEWIGDMRFVRLTIGAGSANQWTPSTAADNYALVDDVGPDDADYVSAAADGLRDLYSLGDFDNSGGKAPKVVNLYLRTKKAVIDASGIIPLLKVGGTVYSGTMISPSMAFATSRILFQEKPAGGAWSDSDFDGLEAGVEAVIP